jgi:hypothetical protein
MVQSGKAPDMGAGSEDSYLKARKQLKVLPEVPPISPVLPIGTVFSVGNPSFSSPGSGSASVSNPEAHRMPADDVPNPGPSATSTPSPPIGREADGAIHPGDPDPNSRIERLELELAAARDEANALRQMLEDLPEIFERKFRQRLHAFHDHHQHLLADNKALRERLYSLSPTHGEGLSQARPELAAGEVPHRQRLFRALRNSLGFRPPAA